MDHPPPYYNQIVRYTHAALPDFARISVSCGVSLAPGFSRVKGAGGGGNGFNRFPQELAGVKPLKRLCLLDAWNTRLKPGANERDNPAARN